MSRVRTWVNNLTGDRTNRITVRIEHRMSLSELETGLGSRYARHHGDGDPLELPRLTGAQILEVVREEYELYGTNAVWTWTERKDDMIVRAVELWAEDVIVQAFPEMDKHRA